MLKPLLKTLVAIIALNFSVNAVAYDDITDGKVQATAASSVLEMQKVAGLLVKEIAQLQDEVGFHSADSRGLLKALGEKEMFAFDKKLQIDEIVKVMNKSQDGDVVLEAYARIQALYKDIRRLNAEANALVK